MTFSRKQLLTVNLKQRAGFKSNDLVILLSTPKQNYGRDITNFKMFTPLESKPKFLILNISVPVIFCFIITGKKHIYTFINI